MRTCQLPIVLTHGFPDSFLRFVKIIPILADPARHGGDGEDAFDVVVPSIPGYGFSDSGGTLFQVGDLWHELMTRVLGHDQYAAHGGDWGSTITGLAAWLVEKFRRWSDCAGDVERRFTKDELLANVTLYWVTDTIDSSLAPYFDIAHAGAGTWIKQGIKQWRGSSDVPAAFAMFPKDLSSPPREWAERFFNVERWTEMPRGGHFAALEEPELLVEHIREFFRPLRRHNALHSNREAARII